jgi:sugar transferase (PEP-CTERM system associated)
MPVFRIFRHYIPASFIILGLIEAVLLYLSFYAGIHLRFLGDSAAVTNSFGSLWPKGLIYTSVTMLCMIAVGLYDRTAWSLEGRSAMLLRVLASFVLAIFPLSLLFYLAPAILLWRGATLLVLGVSLLGIVITRLVFVRVVDKQVLRRRALVLGAGKRARHIRQLEQKLPLLGIEVVGYVHMDTDHESLDDHRVLPLQRPLQEIVSEKKIDEIILAVDDRRQGMPVHEILGCKMDGVDVLDMLTFFERETGRVKLDLVNPSWMFLSDGFRVSVGSAMAKRTFDIVVCLLLLPLFLPLMLIVALAVWLESLGKGSVLYKQVRVGRNNREFTIYKFRSMRVDAESDGCARWAQKNDTRITRIGALIRKARLDELPQIFNVLKGDMSFVGPRPERPTFVEELQAQYPYYRERHRMRPGLTGWAQISYQYGNSAEDAYRKLEYDLYYVKNYSIFLDLLIILQTIHVVLTGKGAH